jgi:hypothetical protein
MSLRFIVSILCSSGEVQVKVIRQTGQAAQLMDGLLLDPESQRLLRAEELERKTLSPALPAREQHTPPDRRSELCGGVVDSTSSVPQ